MGDHSGGFRTYRLSLRQRISFLSFLYKSQCFYPLISLIIFVRIIFRAGNMTAAAAITIFKSIIPIKTILGTAEVKCNNCSTCAI